MEFVIVNAGRNVGSRPLYGPDWVAFRADIQQTLWSVGRIVGQGIGISEWDGVKEEFATFQAEVHETNVPVLRGLLANLARDWGQEAIGFALSGLVEATPEPEPVESPSGSPFEVVAEGYAEIGPDGFRLVLPTIHDDGV